MAFKKISTKKKYLGGYQDTGGNPRYKAGDILVEGVYKGEGHNKFNPDKPNFEFETGDEITVLNSAGHLAYLMDNNVDPGDYCRVTYAGKEELTSGTFKGKECHQFELEVDPDRSTVVASAPAPVETPVEASGEELSLDDLD